MNAAQKILDSWLPTDRLVSMVMNRQQYGNDKYVWELVASTLEDAKAYYNSLDEEFRRSEAAEALAAAGWDMTKINFTLS